MYYFFSPCALSIHQCIYLFIHLSVREREETKKYIEDAVQYIPPARRTCRPAPRWGAWAGWAPWSVVWSCCYDGGGRWSRDGRSFSDSSRGRRGPGLLAYVGPSWPEAQPIECLSFSYDPLREIKQEKIKDFSFLQCELFLNFHLVKKTGTENRKQTITQSCDNWRVTFFNYLLYLQRYVKQHYDYIKSSEMNPNHDMFTISVSSLMQSSVGAIYLLHEPLPVFSTLAVWSDNHYPQSLHDLKILINHQHTTTRVNMLHSVM